jgi:hypothetical protein
LRFNVEGVEFTPTRGDRAASMIPWAAITAMSLRPTRGQPFAATLALACSDRRARTFVIRGYADLARILTAAP